MSSTHPVASGRAVLAADVSGAGDPVVFLHAAVCDRRMWRAQREALAQRNLAIAYDRRGFGETRATPEDHSPVADLMAVIDTLAGGAPAVLVGCSQGGRIALDAALRHPDRVRALLLIAPSVSGAPDPTYPPAIDGLLARQAVAEKARDWDLVNAIKAHLWLDGPLEPEGRVAGAARRLFLDMNAIALQAPPTGANLNLAPAYPRLGEIAAPTLVIWGDRDFPHIQDRCRRMAGAMPNGSAHAMPGVAHLPSLEQPEAVTDLVAGIIGRVRPA